MEGSYSDRLDSYLIFSVVGRVTFAWSACVSAIPRRSWAVSAEPYLRRADQNRRMPAAIPGWTFRVAPPGRGPASHDGHFPPSAPAGVIRRGSRVFFQELPGGLSFDRAACAGGPAA